MPQNRSGQPGQVAVIVLLIMAALLIVVLNYASRTTDQVFLSGQQQDTTRVFNAAESGVEEVLSEFNGANAPATTTDTFSFDNGITANSTVTAQNGELKWPTLLEGMSATIYVGATDQQVRVDWASDNGNCNDRASLLLTLYYTEGGVVKTKHNPVRPGCYDNGLQNNGFTASADSSTADYAHFSVWSGLPVTAEQKILRVTAVYNNTNVLVSDVEGIQAHDVVVRATDQLDSTNTSEERAIQVTRTLPAPPMVLDYAVYSGGDLSKN